MESMHLWMSEDLYGCGIAVADGTERRCAFDIYLDTVVGIRAQIAVGIYY